VEIIMLVSNPSVQCSSLVYEVDNFDRPFAWETVPNGAWEPAQIRHHRNLWTEIRTIQKLGLPLFLAKENPERTHVQVKSVDDTSKELAGSTFLLQCAANNPSFFTKALEAQGGLPIVSAQDYLKLIQWPDHVQDAFTKRRIARVTLGDVWDFASDTLHKDFVAPYTDDESFFLKTEHKKSAFLVGRRSRYPGMLFSMACRFSPTTRLIISSPLDLVTNDEGKEVEYRCFVAEEKLLSVSLHHHDRDEVVPDEIKAFAEEFIRSHIGILPRQYVVDVAIDRHRGPVIIELNPFAGAGRYAGNDIEPWLLTYFSHIPASAMTAVRTEVNDEMQRLEIIRSQLPPFDREAELEKRLKELLGTGL
jgi:hypothetical protein